MRRRPHSGGTSPTTVTTVPHRRPSSPTPSASRPFIAGEHPLVSRRSRVRARRRLFNCLSPNEAFISQRPDQLPQLQDPRVVEQRDGHRRPEVPQHRAARDGGDLRSASSTRRAGRGLSRLPAPVRARAVSRLAKVTTPTAGVGMSDQTGDVTISGALAKDTHTTPSTAIGGTCSGLVNSKYAGTNTAFGVPTPIGHAARECGCAEAHRCVLVRVQHASRLPRTRRRPAPTSCPAR